MARVRRAHDGETVVDSRGSAVVLSEDDYVVTDKENQYPVSKAAFAAIVRQNDREQGNDESPDESPDDSGNED